MYKKAWLVADINSIAESIGGQNIGLHFSNMLPQFTTYFDQETGDSWLIDNNESSAPFEEVELAYSVILGQQGLVSLSTNFVGTRPHKPS